jgi:hypothetical protein
VVGLIPARFAAIGALVWLVAGVPRAALGGA